MCHEHLFWISAACTPHPGPTSSSVAPLRAWLWRWHLVKLTKGAQSILCLHRGDHPCLEPGLVLMEAGGRCRGRGIPLVPFLMGPFDAPMVIWAHQVGGEMQCTRSGKGGSFLTKLAIVAHAVSDTEFLIWRWTSCLRALYRWQFPPPTPVPFCIPQAWFIEVLSIVATTEIWALNTSKDNVCHQNQHFTR